MNTAESAIGHQHHDVAAAVLGHERADDLVHTRNMAGTLPPGLEIAYQVVGRQAFRFGKAGTEDACHDHLVGVSEGLGEVLLKHAAAG